MNILYLNHYAGSPRHGMEYRPYYLSREWVRAGHAVRILAASFSHVRTTQPSAEREAFQGRWIEQIDGVQYVWYPTPVYRGNGAGRVLNIAAFLRRVWEDTPVLIRDAQPDVVIASSTYPFDVPVARRLARLTSARLIFEIHDLWPLSLIELGGMPRWHPFVQLCQWAENAAYRNVDAVVSILPNVHDHVVAHGLAPGKLHVIPNGIDPDGWANVSGELGGALATTLARARARGDFVVGYAGAHGLPNALDTLLDAAGTLRNAGVQFVLVGDGHERERLVRRVRNEQLDHVEMIGAIAKREIPMLLRQVDAAYLGWQDKPIYRFGISPNKLMDYMMAARPVLHAVRAGNDPVADAGCGVSVPPDSPRAIADAILALQAMTPDERCRMGERGRAYVEAHHSYPMLARQFLVVMESLV